MIEGRTKTGFSFVLEEENLDNMELLESLAEIDNGNVAAIPRAAILLLGNEQKKSLYNHIRNDKGKVPIDKFADEITDIMSAIGKQGKNF